MAMTIADMWTQLIEADNEMLKLEVPTEAAAHEIKRALSSYKNRQMKDEATAMVLGDMRLSYFIESLDLAGESEVVLLTIKASSEPQAKSYAVTVADSYTVAGDGNED